MMRKKQKTVCMEDAASAAPFDVDGWYDDMVAARQTPIAVFVEDSDEFFITARCQRPYDEAADHGRWAAMTEHKDEILAHLWNIAGSVGRFRAEPIVSN